MIPTLLGVLFLTFVVVQFVPGGPVEQLANQLTDINVSGEASTGANNIYRGSSGLSEEHLNDLKVFYGFDKPPMERFTNLVVNYLSFDLGKSYFHHQTVSELIISKLPVSITTSVPFNICLSLAFAFSSA